MMRWRTAVSVALAVPLAAAAPGETGTDADVSAADSGPGVRILDTSGKRPVPCPPVDARADPWVEGGCRTVAYEYDTTLSIRTVFGAMDFGDCVTNLEVTFAADGRFWLDNIRIGGAAPCNDVWPCAPPRVIALRKRAADAPPREHVQPWRGRIDAPDGRGGFTGSLDFCLLTCAGRYEGEIGVQLQRHDGAWRLRAQSAGVGDGSLAVDADWDLLDAADLDVRAAP